jgi:hypothetical protein
MEPTSKSRRRAAQGSRQGTAPSVGSLPLACDRSAGCRQYVAPLLRWAQPVTALQLIIAGLYIVAFQFHGGRW